MSDIELLARIQKNALEELRVGIVEWQGSQYIDVRIWIQKEPGDGFEAGAVPTKRGIRIHEELLPELLKALQEVAEFCSESPQERRSLSGKGEVQARGNGA